MMSWDEQPVLGTVGRWEAVEPDLQTSGVCMARTDLAKDRDGIVKRKFWLCMHYFFNFGILLQRLQEIVPEPKIIDVLNCCQATYSFKAILLCDQFDATR